MYKKDSSLSRLTLEVLNENADIAQDTMRPYAKTQVWLVYLWRWGQDVHVQGSLSEAIHEGVRQGYQLGYLRKSVVG